MKKITLSTTQLLYGSSAIIFVCAIGLLGWFLSATFSSQKSISTDEDKNENAVISDDCHYRNNLTGICVATEDEIYSPIAAVMIENHFEARPQSGLSQASIVYEAPVEGNITRFLALFPFSQDVKKVGPVRSARPYYMDWVHEYDNALYLHVGGSPDALLRLKQEDIFDMNEFSFGSYFWRSTDRYAPHNVYSSSELWRRAWDTFVSDHAKTTIRPRWDFASVEGCVGDDCMTQIDIDFAPPTYAAQWRYVSSTEQYMRYQMGIPHADSDGTIITADTIIIQRVKTSVIDSYGRLDMDTVGSGDAVVLYKGRMIEGIWKKENVSDVTQWYTNDGTRIPLNPGTVWIEVLGNNHVYTVY